MKLLEKVSIAALIVLMVFLMVVFAVISASNQNGTTTPQQGQTTNPDSSKLKFGDFFTITNVRHKHVITGEDVNGIRLTHEEFSFDLRALRDVHNVKIYSGDIDYLTVSELVYSVGDMRAGDVRYIPTFTSYWMAQIRCDETVGNYDFRP